MSETLYDDEDGIEEAFEEAYEQMEKAETHLEDTKECLRKMEIAPDIANQIERLEESIEHERVMMNTVYDIDLR